MKTSNVSRGIAVVGLAVGLVAACNEEAAQESGSQSAQTADSLEPGIQDEGDVLVGQAVTTGISQVFQPVYRSTSSTQEIAYGKQYDADDPTKFVVRNRQAVAQQWTIAGEFEFSASFDIVRVDSARQDLFYVLGIASTGDSVIERWKKANIGIPGGQQTYSLKRTELYRGTSLSNIRTIAADPDNRYLLVLHGTSTMTLSRMTLPNGQPIVTLYDSTAIPHLGGVSRLFVMQHNSEGRIWTLESLSASPQPSRDRTLIWDYNNDGAMDAWSTMTYLDYNAQYGASAAPGTWLDDFVEDNS